MTIHKQQLLELFSKAPPDWLSFLDDHLHPDRAMTADAYVSASADRYAEITAAQRRRQPAADGTAQLASILQAIETLTTPFNPREAMGLLAEPIARLAVMALKDNASADKSLQWLAESGTVWAGQAATIRHYRPFFAVLSKTSDLGLFCRMIEKFYDVFLAQIPKKMLAYRGRADFARDFSQWMDAIAWGAFEVLKALFHDRFGSNDSEEVSDARHDVLKPKITVVQSLQGQPPERVQAIASKLATFDPGTLNLLQLISQTAYPFQLRCENLKIDLQVEIPEHLNLRYDFEGRELAKVGAEVLENALKFYDELKTERWIRVSYDEAGRVLQLADNGIGIDSEDLENIWGRRKRGRHPKAKGEGLGLANAKKRIEQMGCTIAVESEVGKGSTFSIVLRVDDVISEPASREQSAPDRVAATDSGVVAFLGNEITPTIPHLMIETAPESGWDDATPTLHREGSAGRGPSGLHQGHRDDAEVLEACDPGYAAVAEGAHQYLQGAIGAPSLALLSAHRLFPL